MSAAVYPPCPPRPALHAPRRARVVLSWFEEGRPQDASEYGWAFIREGWLHFASDEDEAHPWSSWPMMNVMSVVWEPVEYEAITAGDYAERVPRRRPDLEQLP